MPFNSIESTLIEPIRFFLHYPELGRNTLIKEYKEYENNNSYYHPEKGVIIVEHWEENLDGELKIEYSNWPFNDYVIFRFEIELKKSKDFIYEYHQFKGDSENTWLYKKLMKAYTRLDANQKKISTYPEAEIYPKCVLEIYNFAFKLYKGLLSLPTIEKNVKRKLELLDNKVPCTNYILKSGFEGKLNLFNQLLKDGHFIDHETSWKQWYDFFTGKFPEKKINWKSQNPARDLYCFIKCLTKSSILKEKVSQPWTHLGEVFLFAGNEILPKFYKNHNYCNLRLQKEFNRIINTLKP